MNNEIDMLRKNVFDNLQAIEEKDKQLDKYKNVIEKIKEILGNYKHYSTTDEKQNAKNEEIVDKAYELLEEVE